MVEMPHLKLYGSPSIESAGQTIRSLGSRKAWEVLGYLAIRKDKCADRRQLAALLWPDAPLPKAQHRLRQTLQYLFNAVPGSRNWLCVEASRIVLDTTQLTIELQGQIQSDGEFLESFQAVWIDAYRMTAPLDGSFQSTPELDDEVSLTSSLDHQSRFSAIVGLTPGWIVQGKYETALREISQLKQESEFGTNPSLLLCELEILIAAQRLYQIDPIVFHLQMKTEALDDKERLRLKLALSRLAFRRGQGSLAEVLAQQAFDQARDLNDADSAHRALITMAHAAFDAGDQTRAANILRRADVSKSRHESAWIHPIEFLKIAYESQKHSSSDRRRKLERLISRFRDNSRCGIYAIFLARIGRLFESGGDLSRAMELYHDAAARLHRTDCKNEVAEVQTYIGDLSRRQSDFAQSLASHLEAVALRRESKSLLGLATSLRGAGMAAYGLQTYHQAILYLSEAREIFLLIPDEFGAASVDIALARCLLNSGKPKAGKRLFSIALDSISTAPEELRRSNFPEDFQSIEQLRQEFELM